MLVLSRRVNESVVIGDNIVVTVARVGRDCIRLAFDAPHHVPIHRQEIQVRIDAERALADSSRAAAECAIVTMPPVPAAIMLAGPARPCADADVV